MSLDDRVMKQGDWSNFIKWMQKYFPLFATINVQKRAQAIPGAYCNAIGKNLIENAWKVERSGEIPPLHPRKTLCFFVCPRGRCIPSLRANKNEIYKELLAQRLSHGKIINVGNLSKPRTARRWPTLISAMEKELFDAIWKISAREQVFIWRKIL